jgi:hypothetical protein
MLADWLTWYNISMGTTHRLCYLPHDCFPFVVYIEVNKKNILLNTKLNLHFTYIGVTKLVEDNQSVSIVTGSYVYIGLD